jgi:SulP family sulfate permease
MIALIMFSLIHVPINIPAFAVSSNVDVDMNVELMAHGYSNCLVGILGGKLRTTIPPACAWNCSEHD